MQQQQLELRQNVQLIIDSLDALSHKVFLDIMATVGDIEICVYKVKMKDAVEIHFVLEELSRTFVNVRKRKPEPEHLEYLGLAGDAIVYDMPPLIVVHGQSTYMFKGDEESDTTVFTIQMGSWFKAAGWSQPVAAKA